MKEVTRSFVRLVIGLAIMSFGIAMALVADLGIGPWDTLSDGVAKTLQNALGITMANGAPLITFGRSSIAIGILILAADVLVFHERIGFGSFINILLCGTFTDLFSGDLIMGFAMLPDFRGMDLSVSLPLRIVLCVGSLIPSAFGMYFYMSAELGSGPRDTLMCAVARRLPKLPIGAIRIMLEGSALLLGWLLGGAIGLGTVVLVAGNGPVMNVIFRIFKFDVKQLHNQTIPETIAAVRKSFSKK